MEIYWNSHKSKFSIRDKGRVIGYKDKLFITKPTFIVLESGRQRVLSTGQKNVHAFVRGEILDYTRENKQIFNNSENSDYSLAVYNPYDECGHFRVLTVVGDIVISDDFNKYIKMVYAYTYNNEPHLKVKINDEK